MSEVHEVRCAPGDEFLSGDTEATWDDTGSEGPCVSPGLDAPDVAGAEKVNGVDGTRSGFLISSRSRACLRSILLMGDSLNNGESRALHG